MIASFSLFLFVCYIGIAFRWSRQSACFSSPSFYSWAWCSGWSMCSNSSSCCNWSLVCRDQGGTSVTPFILCNVFSSDCFSYLVQLQHKNVSEHRGTSHCHNSKCMRHDLCHYSWWVFGFQDRMDWLWTSCRVMFLWIIYNFLIR